MKETENSATKSGAALDVNPLRALADFGQSVWLDYIRRSLLTSGEFDRLIDEDGLRGCTSNPAIFEKAITGSTDYAAAISELDKQSGANAMTIYEGLAFADIRDAADRLKRVYEATNGVDGYVSIEVSPYLARNTQETLKEARRIWQAVGRPNIMVKVPGTKEGTPAIRQLLSEGININITLLFGIGTYEQVAEAYLQAFEERLKKGQDVSRIASVASFFVSRIDSAVDKQLDALAKNAKSDVERQRYEGLKSKTAIANAKLTYQCYKRIFSGPRWEVLREKRAMVQRLLWASTSTKDPKLSDVLYVEELIGPDTVNTIPPATMDAFRDHGRPAQTLDHEIEGAEKVVADIASAGISLDDVTAKLVDDGVKLFSEAFDKLLAAVDKSCKVFSRDKLNRMSYSLPASMQADVDAALADWQVAGKVRRLWSRDASLWTGTDENNWLGWLGIVDEQLESLGPLSRNPR